MSAATDPPIIITGGSVEITFDAGVFPGTNGKFRNDLRRPVSVEVTDNNTGQKQTIELPTNGKCTVKINTR
ncbi:MAG TPA: hypothetical protein VF668_02480 [Pyrinomonadaceae bacterium]|jgi:hypothetical protein